MKEAVSKKSPSLLSLLGFIISIHMLSIDSPVDKEIRGKNFEDKKRTDFYLESPTFTKNMFYAFIFPLLNC